MSDCNNCNSEQEIIVLEILAGAPGAFGGPQGIQGATGPSGAQGPSGLPSTISGPRGNTGATGPQGESGIGSVGATGERGEQGSTGEAGQSIVGATGASGPRGLAGERGERGDTGVEGPSGQSVTGPSGIPGSKGDTGERGNTGIAGPAGQSITGPSGPRGLQGERGDTGVRGATGPSGAGATGSSGLQGERGDTGVAGATGASGLSIVGATGASGTIGPRGNTGLQGPSGASGLSGIGDTGATGAAFTGATGSRGATGATGPAGQSVIGSTGATGAAFTGATGARGSTGATGQPGQSIVGATGSTGPAGQNGISVIGASGATGATGQPGQSDRYQTASTTNINVSIGEKSFTVQTGLSWTTQQPIIIANQSSGAKMTGFVASYNPSTGAITVIVDAISGSGTYSDWQINLNGLAGVQGATGATGIQGATGEASTVSGPVGGTGATGPVSTVPGATGATGPSGEVGATGLSFTGATGPQSIIPGATGATGPSGEPGAGINIKTPVRVATTANLAGTADNNHQSLIASANGTLVVDGITLNDDDELLIKDQTLATNNGIYVVISAGSASTPWHLDRRGDSNTNTKIKTGDAVSISNGTINGGSSWYLTTAGNINLGTTALNWSLYSKTGATGSSGVQGSTGATGPQGATGIGATGASGVVSPGLSTVIEFTGTGAETEFNGIGTFTNDAAYIVTINGVVQNATYQGATAYTVNSSNGGQIVFTAPPAAGSTIQVRAIFGERGPIGPAGALNAFTFLREQVNIQPTAAASTVQFNVSNQATLYYTLAATSNWTLNLQSSETESLNSILNTGESVTVTFLNTNGATGYKATALTIDGVSVLPKFLAGNLTVSGSPNCIEAWTYTVIKTGSAAYTVLANITRFI